MGRYGSGKRWGCSANDTVEDCYALDVNWMTREGLFDGDGRRGSIRWFNSVTGEQTSRIGYEVNVPARWLRLHYRRIEAEESIDYKVPLTTSELPWDGIRWWFTCPLICDGQYCGRRVGKLFLADGTRYFGCRHCQDLTYRSCRESHRFDRILGRMAMGIGARGDEVMRMWRDDPKWKERLEHQEKRNEQRRRRRKARNWA